MKFWHEHWFYVSQFWLSQTLRTLTSTIRDCRTCRDTELGDGRYSAEPKAHGSTSLPLSCDFPSPLKVTLTSHWVQQISSNVKLTSHWVLQISSKRPPHPKERSASFSSSDRVPNCEQFDKAVRSRLKNGCGSFSRSSSRPFCTPTR